MLKPQSTKKEQVKDNRYRSQNDEEKRLAEDSKKIEEYHHIMELNKKWFENWIDRFYGFLFQQLNVISNKVQITTQNKPCSILITYK